MLRYPMACLALLFVSWGSSSAAEPTKPYIDDFSQAKLGGRSAVRGDWIIADGIARCAQDDELYKKHNDHGPVVWYKVPFKNATVKFAFKPEGTKTFVFTINGDKGHIFRFVSTTAATRILAFPPDSSEHKPILLNREGPALKQGEWINVIVKLEGEKAVVNIGENFSAKVEHAAIAQPKTVVGLGFSFGTLSLKDFSITSQ